VGVVEVAGVEEVVKVVKAVEAKNQNPNHRQGDYHHQNRHQNRQRKNTTSTDRERLGRDGANRPGPSLRVSQNPAQT